MEADDSSQGKQNDKKLSSDNGLITEQNDSLVEPETSKANETTTFLAKTSFQINIDSVLTALKLGRFQYMMLVLTGGAYFAACTEVVVFVFLSKPVKEEWNLDNIVFPLLPFCCGAMRMIGRFILGTLSDKFGRQLPFLCAMGCVAVFGLVSAFAPWFWLLVLLRALVTFGTAGIEAIGFVLLLGVPQKRSEHSPGILHSNNYLGTQQKDF